MGKMTRFKCNPYVISEFRDNINDALKWTPITKRTVINLSSMIKCKHVQFALMPAAAITVYKSQGVTFVIMTNHNKINWFMLS